MPPRTVLVVDDHPLNRELAGDVLEAAGYTVLQAEDGDGLLQRVKRERPDVILLDLRLPGLDGFTLARQLKADPATRRIPVVAVTADLMPERQGRALAAGCDGYLRKPLDARELLEAVSRLIGREV
jgi:CheY-like chemotaxis protein